MINKASYKLSDINDFIGEATSCFKESEPEYLSDLRAKSADRFKALGLPTTKLEDWRFTSIAPVLKVDFNNSDNANNTPLPTFTAYSSIIVVLVNGKFSAKDSNISSLPKGLKISTLKEAISNNEALVKQHLGEHTKDTEHPFVALNTALFEDGVFIHVEKNTVIETPVQIVDLAVTDQNAVAYNTRSLVVVDENSQLTVIEINTGAESTVYLNNNVFEAYVDKASVLYHYRVQNESKQAFHFSTIDGTVESTANFVTQTINFGGKFVRNDVGITLNGKDGFCTMNGLTYLNGSQFVDNHTRLDHAETNCETHELYKTILDDNAKAVFTGKIMVRQIAQKTNAKQTNKNLLLSPTAQIHSNPQLEIFADDVKCTHGATIGQIEASQLYYLKSRGISEAEARRMLVFAFANDIVEKIHVKELREDLEKALLSVSEKPETVGVG